MQRSVPLRCSNLGRNYAIRQGNDRSSCSVSFRPIVADASLAVKPTADSRAPDLSWLLVRS